MAGLADARCLSALGCDPDGEVLVFDMSGSGIRWLSEGLRRGLEKEHSCRRENAFELVANGQTTDQKECLNRGRRECLNSLQSCLGMRVDHMTASTYDTGLIGEGVRAEQRVCGQLILVPLHSSNTYSPTRSLTLALNPLSFFFSPTLPRPTHPGHILPFGQL